MKIEKYLETYKKILRPRTLGFLIKDNQILLGYKKRGFGEGNLNGIGGKVEEGENIEEGLIREVQEEIFVTPVEYKKLAVLNFYFPYSEDQDSWNQQVFAYKISGWKGDPKESEEIKPGWFDIAKIPYESMWADDKLWLERFLQDKNIKASFLFGKDLKVEDYLIEEV